MPTFTRIQLTTEQPFHFGKRGVGLNETEVALPADTVFSAFCTAFAALYGSTALQNLLARFPTPTEQPNPPWRLSSLMPYCRDVDLLPMPYLRPRLGAVQIEKRKLFKQIDWVSPSVFQRLTAGEEVAASGDLLDAHHNPYTVQGGHVWVSRSEQTQIGGAEALLWKTDIRPRVTIDRITNAATAYSSGGLYFNHGVGLYALIRWEEAEDTTLLAELKAAFALLGSQGIGGERAYGYGHFTPSFRTVALPGWDKPAPYYTTLSPYLPQHGERTSLQGGARYAITLRRGWLSLPGYSHLRRPTVRMVAAGAVLAAPDQRAPVGCLADATPEPMRDSGITIRRYGLAWPVPLAARAVEEE